MSKMVRPINILFLCVANSARSQLAEGIAKSIFAQRAHIESAGSKPSGQVHPWAIEVLKESEIDISKNWSKSIDDLPHDFLNNLDYVITLCAEEVCPIFISKAIRLHWPITDPAAATEDAKQQSFRRVRDEIKVRLTVWASDL